jgi:F0F1-type ATP synthase assembly protein I
VPHDESGEEDERGREMGKKRQPGSTLWRADRYASIGFQIALSLVVYIVAGNWLDKRLGTDPWLTLVGALLGFVTMMFLIIRLAKHGDDHGDDHGANTG